MSNTIICLRHLTSQMFYFCTSYEFLFNLWSSHIILPKIDHYINISRLYNLYYIKEKVTKAAYGKAILQNDAVL